IGSWTWPGPESSGSTGLSLCGCAGFHNSVLTILLAGASVYITPLHLAGAFTRIPKFAPAFIQLSLWWGRPSQWDLSGADPLGLRRSPIDPLGERSSPSGSALTQSPRRGRTIETGRSGGRKERTGRVGGSSAELVPRRFGRPRF